MKKILNNISNFVLLVLVLSLAGCREEVTIFLPEHVSVEQGDTRLL